MFNLKLKCFFFINRSRALSFVYNEPKCEHHSFAINKNNFETATRTRKLFCCSLYLLYSYRTVKPGPVPYDYITGFCRVNGRVQVDAIVRDCTFS